LPSLLKEVENRYIRHWRPFVYIYFKAWYTTRGILLKSISLFPFFSE
jgi:hypothetical protein